MSCGGHIRSSLVRSVGFACWLAATTAATAQPVGVLQRDDPYQVYLEEQWTRGRLPGAFLLHRPLAGYAASALVDSIPGSTGPGPGVEAVSNWALVRWYRSLVPGLWADGENLASEYTGDYAFQANLLANVSMGPGRSVVAPSVSATTSPDVWRNTRGIRFSGRVGRHVFFESSLEGTQRKPVRPAREQWTAPGLNFVRLTRDSLVYDYQIAVGELGLVTGPFEFRLGRNRLSFSQGDGSLFLSGFAPIVDFVQIRSTFRRFQFVNLYTALTDISPGMDLPPNRVFPRKYGIFHSLAYNFSNRLQVQFFESVIMGADSLGGRDGRFDVTYLNPVSLLRALEADRGSPDNALIGVGGSWIVLPGLRVYGQFMLDEFVFSAIGTAAWQNKWGILAGLHIATPAASVRVETARLRPFLYTHSTATAAYVHYRDGLGHAAGPNAIDYLLDLNVRPSTRVTMRWISTVTRRGQGIDGANVGSDPLVSYVHRAHGDTAFLLADRAQWHVRSYASLSYELLPRMYVEGALTYERLDSPVDDDFEYWLPSLGVRWGLPADTGR